MERHVDTTLHVAYAECPYCDGENVIEKARSDRGGLELIDYEIPCKHCQSLFALSQSKLKVRTLGKREFDAA